MEQGKSVIASQSSMMDLPAVSANIRAALEPARTHAISLHDEQGDVLFLSEGSMGPDEHNAVHNALEHFADPNAAPIEAFDLGDSRHAVMIRTINARRAMVGLVMIVMDSRIVARGANKLMTPKLQRALCDFAALRPPLTAAPALAGAPAPVSSPPGATPGSHAPPGAGMSSVARGAARSAGRSAAAPAPVARAAQVTPELDKLHETMRKSPIALHVQRLMPLSKGTQLKRYEVLLRLRSASAPHVAPQAMLKAAIERGLGSMIDRRVVTELIGWLVRNPEVWQGSQAMFSVNLTTTALHDEHFMKFVELCLAKSCLPKGTVAFEIDTQATLHLRERVTEVAAALHRLGCPVVLDDFSFKTECFALLRLPGVRYVKLAPEITAKMRTDKLSQASITAVVQMARVLGMHTVAKRTESEAEQEWLTALGVDFIQSNALSPPVAIESLATAAKT